MNTKNNIESALEVINDNLMWVDEEQHPSINDIRLALSGHGNITRVNQDNSTSNITKNIEERYNDDPFDTAYESALNAKIRAQQ
jgi:hypothetical protein